MKYALIVMVAVYLITFGCNPKSDEEHSSHEATAEHATVDKTPASPAHLEVTAHDTHSETAAAPEKEVAEKAVESKGDQYNAIAKSAASTVLTLMNDDNEAAAEKVEQETEAAQPAKPEETVAKVEAVAEKEEQPVKVEEKAEAAQVATTEEAIVKEQQKPCPKVAGKAPCVVPGGMPCDNVAENAKAKDAVAPAEEAELSDAMQKMVDATNNMVAITRQLVLATQQMLSASKDVAVEVVDSGKEALEASKPAVEAAINEEEIIETVKEVVEATKEAYEATAEAITNAIESKEAAPEVPVASPQQ